MLEKKKKKNQKNIDRYKKTTIWQYILQEKF